MVVVKKRPGEADEALIRRFSKDVTKEGILIEARRKAVHLKPSLAKKQKKEDARRMAKMGYAGY